MVLMCTLCVGTAGDEIVRVFWLSGIVIGKVVGSGWFSTIMAQMLNRVG